MQVKRFCGLLLGVLFVLGISSSATGQQITAGITIRVDEPDSGKAVAIGDSIFVRVINTLPIHPELVIVRIVQAVSSTDTVSSRPPIGNKFMVSIAEGDTADITKVGGQPTFRAAFAVEEGDGEFPTLLAVTAEVRSDSATAGTRFSNLNTNNAVAVAPERGKTGDGKTFGIDGTRPLNANNIAYVYLDANIRPSVLIAVEDGSPTMTNRGYVPRLLSNTIGRFGYKAGEVMGINVVVEQAFINQAAQGSGVRGITVLVDTAGATEANARIKVEFTALDFLDESITKSAGDTLSLDQIATTYVANTHSGSAIARKTITLDPTSKFTGKPVGGSAVSDVYPRAAVTDIAGNTAAVYFTPPVRRWVKIDVQAPELEVITPSILENGEVGWFTGVVSYAYDVINFSGDAFEEEVKAAQPIEWNLDEIADSFTVEIKKDKNTRTWTRGAAGGIQAKGKFTMDVADTMGMVAGVTSELRVEGAITPPAAAGSVVDVILAATDSVGNTTKVTVNGATFDSTRLSFGSYFPRVIAGSNKDTFNAATSPVVFLLSEPADSVLIVYRKLGTSSGTIRTARGAGGGNPNIDLTSTTVTQKVDIDVGSLVDKTFYALQLFGRDRAYNWTVTEPPDTLFYDVGFQAAQPDSIRVEVMTNDTVVVGGDESGVTLQVTGWDTVLSANAPDYNPDGVLVTVWSSDETADLSGVHISGMGVTEQPALIEGGRRRATLGHQWILGSRSITVSNMVAQDRIFVNVMDTVSAVHSSGKSAGLVYEAGQMTKYRLMASSLDTTDEQAGRAFLVQVQPQDKFGNPSLKQADLIYTDSSGGNALEVIYLEFSSNYEGLGVPQGPQTIGSAGWTEFSFQAPNVNDEVLVTAVTTNLEGTSAQAQAIGTLYVRITGGPVGPQPPVDPTVLKPDTLVVENYMGADGMGDQGGFVLATWPNTTQHGQLSAYRIWRFIQVNHGLDDSGALTELTASAGEWVPWAKVDAVPPIVGAQAVSWAVIPTLDNQQTRWAITAEMGGKPSDATLSLAKVVYSAESVKQTLALLGIRSVMPAEEVLNIFGPSYEYRTSILGDRKDLLLGVLDLDGLRKTAMRLPEGIRAQVAQVRASGATVAAGLAAGTDDLPPVAVSGEEATTDDREVTLTWEVSVDDRIVGLIPYRGYITPIPGVWTYEILRGPDDENLEVVASLSAGSGSFSEVVPEEFGDEFVYRIDATDLDNTTLGQPVLVSFERRRIQYFTATSTPVFLMLAEGDPHFNLVADLDDFFEFSYNFGQDDAAGNPVLNPQADTNDDGKVDLDDFFAFSVSFGLEAEAPSTESAGKIAVQMPAFGANRETGLELKLASARVLPGQPVQVDVTVSDAVDLKGYGFTLTYDAQKFELVEVTPGDDNLLTQGGVTPVFLEVTGPGKVQVANAISGEGSVAGSGTVAQLVFNVKGEFEDAVRFEIDNGILIDGDRLLNPVLTLDVLEIQTTPTKFALRQNYPNPFNPETTIKFDLAESGQVELRIYNMVGQVVRTLVDENQAAGRYSIRWDGRDDRGLTVSSGIYFYSLRADKFRAVKKLMLLK